jgi:phosphate acetyltransferase
MARIILVVATGQGSGLTSVCLGLVTALRQRGLDVGFSKPLAQPGATGPTDRSTALIGLTSTLRPPEPLPTAEVERLLSKNALESLMEQVIAGAGAVVTAHDVVIVEGLAPGPDLAYAHRVNVALAKAFDADVLLVGSVGNASSGNGGADEDPVEHLAETMAITAQTYRAQEHDRVIGAVVNRLPSTSPEAIKALRQALAEHDLPLAGAIGFQVELTRARVRELVADLQITVLNQGDPDRRVTDVIIGAQAVPGILPLLRPGRLVIVPGDRHDVILSVCLAAMNGTPLAGLLLTVGLEPDPRVWDLCRPAADTGLPILLTPTYSYETATIVHAVDPEVPADDLERARLVSTAVAGALDPQWLAALPTPTHAIRLSPPAFRHQLTTAARQAARRIVLPEGAEPRTLQAAVLCHEQGIARCVLLATPREVTAQATALGLTLPPDLEIVDPADPDPRYLAELLEARRHKGLTEAVARDQLADPIVLGTLMLRRDEVDGLVAGAVHTTAATVRPALQLLGTAPGARLVSSIFFMCLPDEVVVYGDCAVNPNPDAAQLADIAIQSAASARAFGIEPRVAMISFSTGGSGSGADVVLVTEATRLVREREPGLLVDGPLQYDAAATASVAAGKAPGSPVAGRATVFVFPDLNTGNTTYKAVQRSADVVSIGPMLQGLSKPVNDLSRGARVEDIVYTIALTAIQAQQRTQAQERAEAGQPTH